MRAMHLCKLVVEKGVSIVCCIDLDKQQQKQQQEQQLRYHILLQLHSHYIIDALLTARRWQAPLQESASQLRARD